MHLLLAQTLAAVRIQRGVLDDHSNETPLPIRFPKGVLAIAQVYNRRTDCQVPTVMLFLTGTDHSSINEVELDVVGAPHLSIRSIGTNLGVEINHVLDVENFFAEHMKHHVFIEAVAYDTLAS